ncbi:MAG TPA: TraR/DksA C4-type zinc finger protein [Burkholderiales bacterium]|jgi:RNA polymerase-binding transcription factor DksA|nr:TraR/DksA C4-type zinc finger protein [Burkholderiales bacterium]
MKAPQKDQLRRALEQRRETLVQELKGDTARVRENLEDEAVPDLSRDDAELRDIEAALRRLDDGSYGVCTDCGVEIGFERLHAEPEAARCLDCQRRHEKTYRR